MTLLYFAYGSTMLMARLKRHCDRGRPAGNAYASDQVIEFSRPCKNSVIFLSAR